MTHADFAEQEDPRLQADPVLGLSGGRATVGQIVVSIVAAIVILLVTLYGLVHEPGKMPGSTPALQNIDLILSTAAGTAKR